MTVTEHQLSHLEVAPEQRTEQTLNWLNFVGNDERKLLITLALEESNEPLGKSGLYHQLNALSGPQGIPGDLTAPAQFCGKSLKQVNAVRSSEVEVMRFGKRPTIAAGFELTEEGREFGVPFAGALLGWSRRHPDFSLNILGNTASRTSTRAPLSRFWMLYDLATTPDDPKTLR